MNMESGLCGTENEILCIIYINVSLQYLEDWYKNEIDR